MLLQWLTFASATLAASFAGRRAVQGWLYDQLDRREIRRTRLAAWSPGGVDTWIVKPGGSPAELDPSQRTATVTVTVCGKDGEPDPGQAERLRRYLAENDCLSRNPTPAELEALEQAAKDDGGLPVTRARQRRPVRWRRQGVRQ